jgi:hypothetical protein
MVEALYFPMGMNMHCIPIKPKKTSIFVMNVKISLKSDDGLGNVFSDLPLVVFSQSRNLRDQLVPSDLPHQDIPEQPLFAPLLDGNYKCNGIYM